ncbi:hypothetical protein [Leptospira noguchii]|uniref:hypothetical protein n=1 Tax=Leptospira noguchii TaxID=28182 RepID=UPI0002E1FB60|nr:hypothetical protein [Leptospira noguchii]UOG47407.1 hypothetical protein MAL00_09920 [Leptospira noguchii]UOG59189.1 hypothetical protein MAL07_10155 [Leptospira noguchii]
MFFTKAFETKAKRFPKLSAFASTVGRSNSASHFHGSFDGSRLKLSKTLFTKAFKTQQNAFYESV